MGHICAQLLSDSDIRFLGKSGPEPELEPDSKKTAGYPAIRNTEPDIRYIPSFIITILTIRYSTLSLSSQNISFL